MSSERVGPRGGDVGREPGGELRAEHKGHRLGSTGQTCAQATGVRVGAASGPPLNGEAGQAHTRPGGHGSVLPCCLKSMAVAGSASHGERNLSWDVGRKGRQTEQEDRLEDGVSTHVR